MAAVAEAVEVDPAAVAYIRYLVDEFKTTSFGDACFDQTALEYGGDLFRHRPEPSTVPADVARALDAIEDLLWKGSPTLAAYERQEIRDRRLDQQDSVDAAMARVRSLWGELDGRRDAVDAKERRLRAARAAARRHRDMLATAAAGADGAEAATGAVVSLLERLNRAEEEEAALAAAAESLRASLPWLVEQLEMAKDDAKEEMAQLETMPPQLAGDGDDVLVLFKAERRFAKSLRVLRRFMKVQEAAY